MNNIERNGVYSNANLTDDEINTTESCLKEGEDFYGTSAYEKLYEYFTTQTGEMPYGTAKARDGDPDIWILERLEQ